MWESCRSMPLVGEFSRGSAIPLSPCIPALLHANLTSSAPLGFCTATSLEWEKRKRGGGVFHLVVVGLALCRPSGWMTQPTRVLSTLAGPSILVTGCGRTWDPPLKVCPHEATALMEQGLWSPSNPAILPQLLTAYGTSALYELIALFAIMLDCELPAELGAVFNTRGYQNNNIPLLSENTEVRFFDFVSKTSSPNVHIALCPHDKIYLKRVYTGVTFAIGSEFIRLALDDSTPIAGLQGNKKRIPCCQMTVESSLRFVENAKSPLPLITVEQTEEQWRIVSFDVGAYPNCDWMREALGADRAPSYRMLGFRLARDLMTR
ncbi:hypothetical protein PR048_027324 [Dryococelus australis]|uniref:Uncharacterized protein n=1 Tax=Dryococelus australis TaxID=614101 RepID=A0ABQ9GGM7_9NEOP|nr:hypothetical protein PR048_027324 [Dryococelus australis]